MLVGLEVYSVMMKVQLSVDLLELMLGECLV